MAQALKKIVGPLLAVLLLVAGASPVAVGTWGRYSSPAGTASAGAAHSSDTPAARVRPRSVSERVTGL